MADSGHRPPDTKSEYIARIIEGYFPIREVDVASISQLPSYEDRNYLFHAVTGDSPRTEKYVFKISNISYTKNQDVVRATHAVMRYVAERGIPSPLPLPSISGDDLVVVNEGDLSGDQAVPGRDYIVRVFCYLPGEPLTDINLCPRLLYDVGATAGKLDAILKSFQSSALRKCGREFDLERSLELRAILPAMENQKHRAIAEKVFNMFEDHVISRLPQLTYGVIHSDLHDLNILAQLTDQSYQVSGVLDFIDCFYSYYVYELGTLMAELMPKKKDPVHWVCPLVAGYQNAFPLSPTEFDCLYYVVLTRLCLSAILCYKYYQEEQSNTYLLSGVDGFWELAEELLSTPKDEVDHIWKNAAFE